MRWPVFLLFALLFMAMQFSLRHVFVLHSVAGVAPDFAACLAVFVTLFARRQSALWACWLLGILMDLAPLETDMDYYLLGRHALGYLAGGFVVLSLRTMVFRRRTLTAGFLTLIFLSAAGILSTIIILVRSWYSIDETIFSSWWSELIWRLGVAVYSGFVAVPIGWLLARTTSWWGFQFGVPGRWA